MSAEERALASGLLAGYREEIALVDALIQDVLDEWEVGGTRKLWRALERAVRKMRRARASGQQTPFRESLDEIADLIRRGGAQAERRQELLKLLELRRKLAMCETRLVAAATETYTVEQVQAMLVALGTAANQVLREHPRLFSELNHRFEAKLSELFKESAS